MKLENGIFKFCNIRRNSRSCSAHLSLDFWTIIWAQSVLCWLQNSEGPWETAGCAGEWTASCSAAATRVFFAMGSREALIYSLWYKWLNRPFGSLSCNCWVNTYVRVEKSDIAWKGRPLFGHRVGTVSCRNPTSAVPPTWWPWLTPVGGGGSVSP